MHARPKDENPSAQLVISIVSWNTQELLRKCLVSLRRFVRTGHTRVVVIDNKSKDGTPEMIRAEFPEVTLIESGGNLGFGRGHNLLARHSSEPFVLFLNPDTEFIEPAHERMIEVFLKNPRVAAVGSRMVDPDGTVNPLGIQWFPSPWTELVNNLFVSFSTQSFARAILPWQDPNSPGLVKKLYGGCLMVRRAVLDELGWFDDRFFMYGEDVDLSKRIYESGHELYYMATTSVIHLGGGASAKAPGRFAVLMQCESLSKFMQKYYGSAGRFLYVCGIFFRAILRLSVLSLLRMGRLVLRGRSDSMQASWGKHVAMLQWSLGLARPSIPG